MAFLFVLFGLRIDPAQAAEWRPAQGHRFLAVKPAPAAAADGEARAVGFRRIAGAQSGILFTNLLADERSITNRNLLSGSGVAAGDFDGDGWCDLYFCGLDSANRLYRNLGGWKFEDVTAAAGADLGCAGQDSTAAVFADVDGDGDLDLLVNALGAGTRLFVNQGRGRFEERTDDAGLRSKAGSMSMALADVDGDGDLDLYVTNFRPTTIRDRMETRFRVRMVGGAPVIESVNDQPTTLPELANRFVVAPSGTVLELGEPDALYLNDGAGRFRAVSFTDGTFLDAAGQPLSEPPRDWGLAVQFHDFTGDGLPDIYVCNDLFTPDQIWINQGGKFRAVDPLAIRNTATFSMGVDFGDLDRDGHVDFFVTDMLSRELSKRHVQLSESAPARAPAGLIDNRPQVLRNSLQRNRGDGTFAELTWFAGVAASDWSWGPILLDVDLDGYEDILIPNGQWRDFQNIDLANRIEASRASQKLSAAELVQMLNFYPRLATTNVIYRNRGDWTFEDAGSRWGFDWGSISQGMAAADFDNDGDLDLAFNELNGQAVLMQNLCAAPRVAIRLRGASPNPSGIGARIRVEGGPVSQSQEMICGGRYLSGDEAMRVFAAGAARQLRIEVTWRSGRRTRVEGIEPDTIWELAESGATENPPLAQPAVSPIFEDLTPWLRHQHAEEDFDDLVRQPLLPNYLSQLGPGVAWHDLDGDGWEDLVIGAGRGGRLAALRNLAGKGFEPMPNSIFARPVGRDLTAVLGMGTAIVAGSSNYEDGTTNGGCLRIYDLRANAAGDSVLGVAWSAGPLALADIDGDGDLDLFVGGRVMPGRYPEPTDSLLLKNENGRLTLARRWEKLGLVSGAVFSDLTGDGFPELILACEWGPVRVFTNQRGEFTEATAALGLQPHSGWWNGVATGDLDGDGRLDIVASNWGLNTRHRASLAHPAVLRYGDLDGNGVVDLVECVWDSAARKEIPGRWLRTVGAAMPEVLQRAGTFERYGSMDVHEAFGEDLRGAGRLEAATLESMVFFNRGARFEGRALPPEAQWAVAMGVVVADFDGDGAEDVFLGQNFFAVNPDDTRSDAGRGLLLRGDGKGGLRPVPGAASGLLVYGDQRGCAAADFDGDGRMDLVVAQNGAATRLFKNRGAKPGLRVRLVSGNPLTPNGVGAVLRVATPAGRGPAREIRAGGGYWSQDGAVQVLAAPEANAVLEVRWPGGRATRSEIPPGVTEIQVDAEGSLRARRP